MISLRIIKRDDKYVVQIGIERWWTQKLKWIDLEEHFKYLQRGKATSGYQPFPCNTIFNDLEKAEQTCEYYIRTEDLREKNNGVVIKTYNTGLNDIVWPRYPMPKCKEPKMPDTLCGLPIKIVDCGSFEVSIQTTSNSTFEILSGDDIEQNECVGKACSICGNIIDVVEE